MRLIHTADIHLDSKMRANLSSDKAKERKHEILKTFINMVNYASDNDVFAILISGDLFDTRKISSLVKNAVENVIINNPQVKFFYLKGNHDNTNFFSENAEIPGNLFLFGDEWQGYAIGERINVWGIELSEGNSNEIQKSFAPNPSLTNIVMLHGQEAGSDSRDKAEIININNFKNKGIDYLALGHIHEYKLNKLDSDNSYYCYPGCLEARGFDETGEHGFVLLDIDDETGIVTPSFVPFAKRKTINAVIDVTGVGNTMDIIAKIDKELPNIAPDSCDLVKITLSGKITPDTEIDTDFIRRHFEGGYYFLKVKDESEIHVNFEDYALDESLKGEFVRLVNASDMTDEEKGAIIKYGIDAINGGIEE